MSEKFEVKDGLKIPSGKQLELAGYSLSGISNDASLADANPDHLPTEYAVKSYIDSNNQWTLSDGTNSSVVDAGNTLTINGTSNEVDVSVTEDGDAFAIGLPSDIVIGDTLTVTGNLSAAAEKLFIGGTAMTCTADELNKLDGNAVSSADFTKLSEVTATSSELNIIDGGTTAAASLTAASGDRVVYNDNGTMKQVNIDDIDTYFSGTTNTLTNKTLTSPDINNADIDGGTIDDATIAASDVTVGAGKTLNVSAGTLTTSEAQNKAILEGLADNADPDLGNNVLTAESFTSDVATGTAPFAVSSTTMVDNLNVESLSGMKVIDEDDMASDSATRLPTQQSVKAYVDSTVGATVMTFTTDTDGSDTIDLNDETLVLSGMEGMNVTHTDNTILFAAEKASETNLGVATFDGTDFTVDSEGDVTVKAERIQDIIGGMLSGNTENGISVTYQDSDGTIDFDVNDPTITISGPVTGEATMSDLGNVEITVAQQANSVDLTTHTTGNYVATVAGGTGLSTTGSDGEGATHSLSVDTAQNHILSATSLSAVGTIETGTWNATPVATAYIADDAVTLDKMDSLNNANFILGNASNNPTAVTMSGDATMANDGAVTIAAGAVENDMLAGSIANNKLVNSTLSAGGVEFTLGGSVAQPAFDLTSADSYPGDASLVTTGALESGSITSGFGSIDIGTSTLDCGDISGDSITMTGFTVSTTGLTTMLSGSQLNSASAAAVVANADIANKAYVDSVVSNSDLDFQGDSGGALAIDLDSQVLDIAGGTNITTTGANQTLTVDMDSDISLTSGTFSSRIDTVALSATGQVDLAAAGVATDIKGTLSVDGTATFDVQAVFDGGIDCNSDLSIENNDIIGTADNMLLQADDETAHTFTGTNKMALQALSGIEMVNNVKFSADIESNIIPDADSTRSLGDANNHWSATYSDEVVLEHGKTTSFSVEPASAAAEKVMSFAHASFKSAKVSMNIKSGDNYTAREVLIVCKDDGTSPKLVEYGLISTGSELGALSVAVNGNDIELKVASANGMPCTGVVTLSE